MKKKTEKWKRKSALLTQFSVEGIKFPTSFFPVTSAYVGISPQNFLTHLTLLPHWYNISSGHT